MKTEIYSKEYINNALSVTNIEPQNEQDWIALDWTYSVLRKEPGYEELCKELLTKLKTHQWEEIPHVEL